MNKETQGCEEGENNETRCSEEGCEEGENSETQCSEEGENNETQDFDMRDKAVHGL